MAHRVGDRPGTYHMKEMMMATATMTKPTTGKSSLEDLATQINREHEQIEEASLTTLEHARKAGELLLEAKRRLKHAKWLPWLKDNCKVTPRTEQRYMRVATRWDDVVRKSDTVTHLTLRDVLQLLADNNGKSKKEPPVESNSEGRLRVHVEAQEEADGDGGPQEEDADFDANAYSAMCAMRAFEWLERIGKNDRQRKRRLRDVADWIRDQLRNER
jgi:hypothetical protein